QFPRPRCGDAFPSLGESEQPRRADYASERNPRSAFHSRFAAWDKRSTPRLASLCQAGLEELVVGPREWGAGFVNLDRSGSLSKVNYIIEFRRAGHPRLREITPCHPERECWTGLFVANLLVSDEVLQMID